MSSSVLFSPNLSRNIKPGDTNICGTRVAGTPQSMTVDIDCGADYEQNGVVDHLISDGLGEAILYSHPQQVNLTVQFSNSSPFLTEHQQAVSVGKANLVGRFGRLVRIDLVAPQKYRYLRLIINITGNHNFGFRLLHISSYTDVGRSPIVATSSDLTVRNLGAIGAYRAYKFKYKGITLENKNTFRDQILRRSDYSLVYCYDKENQIFDGHEVLLGKITDIAILKANPQASNFNIDFTFEERF